MDALNKKSFEKYKSIQYKNNLALIAAVTL
jgi:hypothetical protein